MKIPIRRVDPGLPLPEYKTSGAAAMDCPARETVVIGARSVGRVPLNFCVALPIGHFALVAARSSLHKRGLMFANGVGILDEDFRGNEDECLALLYNFTDADITVAAGDRVAQVVVLPFDRVEWEEVTTLPDASRGGIGTTGI